MSSESFTMMSITAKPELEKSSFEEIRIQDYIKSYQTTGRPPPPCPQEPKNDAQRAALNLPPLFQGYVCTSASIPTISNPAPISTIPSNRITNPINIPPAQEFRTFTVSGEKYQSISCMQEYEQFSHEELRYYAYFRGHKQPPTPVLMDPFVMPTLPDPPLPVGPNEAFQNLCAQPEYNRHSPEELRVAYLVHRRQLTSAEIFRLQNPSASTGLTPAGAWPPPSSTAAPSAPSLIPPPIFASPSSKFTFGMP